MDYLFEKKLQIYLNSACVLFEKQGRVDLANVLRFGKADLQLETGFDNWDGGQYTHTLSLTVPIEVFNEIIDNLGENEQCIMSMINKVSNDAKNESLESVSILVDETLTPSVEKLVKLVKGVKVKTAFDEYTLDAQLGQGGNGRVFSAKAGDGSSCAIKFLDKGVSANKIRRFKNEIRFCELCHHSNIVEILDYGYIEVGGAGCPFYVMPLYAVSLRQKINAGISHDQILPMFYGLLSGLQYAHQHGVIHRDIKPENIMFAKESNIPIICDFGIAHLPRDFMATTVVTQKTDRMANWRYAAPEQKDNGAKAYPQSDIYSAFLILNEMFTREVPASVGYKTIGDVAQGYSFLDEVFAQVYRQNPEQRLYPEEKIILEIKTRAGLQQNREEVERLEKIVYNTPQSTIVVPHLVEMTYKNGSLFFGFDTEVPDAWLELMRQGSFNRSALMGYGPNRVMRLDRSHLCMSVSYDMEPQYVKQIADCFKDWVFSVNALYSDEIRRWEALMLRQQEEERKQQIARLKKESEIQSLLAK